MATQSTYPGPERFAPHPEHRRRGRDCGRVLVLNATYEPINVCTVRRAAVLLLKDKAEIVEHARFELRSENATLPRPVVIRLVTFVKVPRDTHRRKITRRSKGGPSTWENIVASCAPCNRRKGDHLPHKVGMHPRQAPRVPHPQVFIHVASPTIPPAWRQWLPAGA